MSQKEGPTMTANEIVEPLREYMLAHKTKDSADYNECDKGPCLWCENAQKSIDAITELERDKARLDWIEDHGATINANGGIGSVPHCWNGTQSSSKENHFYGETYRQAIDAALAAEKEREG